jgi:3-(methylthio)propionyl---CoA ligase
VAVIGRPHLKWGERPVIVVETRDAAMVTHANVQAVLRGKVPSWWIPDELIRVSRMPLSPTGKIDKARLRVEYGGGP